MHWHTHMARMTLRQIRMVHTLNWVSVNQIPLISVIKRLISTRETKAELDGSSLAASTGPCLGALSPNRWRTGWEARWAPTQDGETWPQRPCRCRARPRGARAAQLRVLQIDLAARRHPARPSRGARGHTGATCTSLVQIYGAPRRHP